MASVNSPSKSGRALQTNELGMSAEANPRRPASATTKTIALLRAVSPAITRCALSYLDRKRIDVAKAQRQHQAYGAALRKLGLETVRLPALADAPDGVFVEDTAVVLDEFALIPHPIIASRRSESASVCAELAKHRRLEALDLDDHLDGGDVLRIGRTVFVGRSTRTCTEAFIRLRDLAEPFGYRLKMVPLAGCLHLKTAVTFIPPDVVILNPDWVDPMIFRDYRVRKVDREEPFAANTLTLNGVTLVAASGPRTEEKLNAAGVVTRRLEISELQKAEAGLTCMSILVAPGRPIPAVATKTYPEKLRDEFCVRVR